MPAIRLRSAPQSAAESAALPPLQSLTIGGNATCFQTCVPGAASSCNVAAKRKLASGVPSCRKHTATGLRSRQVSDRHRGYGERSSKPVAGVVEGSKSVIYGYDANGRRASLTYPDSKSVEYTYDPDERLSTVTDWLSHVTQYGYDPAGNLAKTQYPNKASIAYAYDAANRLTSVVNNTVGVPPLAFKYTLDPVGNRTVINEGGIPTNYGYDALNELTSAQITFLKTTWTYDPVGNRLSQGSLLGVTNYSYDASDRLLKAGTRSFTYDADGNQTSVLDSIAHGKHTYTWNAANRLVSVDGGLTDSFVYDGDGNRVSQSGAGQTQNYINDNAAALPVVLQDTYSVGSPSSYVYGLSLIEAFQGHDNDFYQYDGLGSAIQLTNAAGIPELSYFYDAWGNSLLPAPPTNPFRFASQALDSVTGLYYLRARYYDPTQGRFISNDAFRGVLSAPLTENRYIYTLNRPIGLSDPTGFAAEGAPASNFAPFIGATTFSTPANAVSTAPLAPANSAAPSSQPASEAPITGVCYVELQTPPGTDLILDAIGWITLGAVDPALEQPFGPIGTGQSGGYLVPMTCTTGLKA